MNTSTMAKTETGSPTIYRFSSPGLAEAFAERCLKAMMVLLGDDEKFWVVTMADGERLLRAGYEVAR